jgi:hypothetical protein
VPKIVTKIALFGIRVQERPGLLFILILVVESEFGLNAGLSITLINRKSPRS